MEKLLLEDNRITLYLRNLKSDEIGLLIIGIVVLIVSCLVYWIYFYRRERSVTAQCRKTLQKVFKMNNGDMWITKYRNQWQSSAPLSTWAGIEVHDYGVGDVVTEINMRDNKNFIGEAAYIQRHGNFNNRLRL